MFNLQNLNGLFNLSPETLNQINKAASVASVPKPAPTPSFNLPANINFGRIAPPTSTQATPTPPARQAPTPSFNLPANINFGGMMQPARPVAASSDIVNPVVVETDNSFAIPNVSLSNTDTGFTTVIDPVIGQTEVIETANPIAIPNGSFSNTITDSTQQPTPSAPAMSWDDVYRQQLLDRGVINEQGDILKPGGINPTRFMRGEPPSWASPALIKNAYIEAFKSKARAGQDFTESGDYQNFLNAGYSLTQDQIEAIDGVRGQGSQGGLTFGGGEIANVANEPVATARTLTAEEQTFLTLLQELGLGSLANAFQGNTAADPIVGFMGDRYTPAVPQMPTATPVDFSMTLPNFQAPALSNNLGYNPFMGLYEMPREETPQTVTERTGLFNYIYGPQG